MKERPGEAERIHPYYLTSENLFAKEECEWIVKNVPLVYRGAMSEHTRDDNCKHIFCNNELNVLSS